MRKSSSEVKTRVARFFLVQHTKKGKETKMTKNIPNGLKYAATKFTIYQKLSLQYTPKFTQIGIFVLKICIPYGNPGENVSIFVGALRGMQWISIEQ
jgi:hypothetical protein